MHACKLRLLLPSLEFTKGSVEKRIAEGLPVRDTLVLTLCSYMPLFHTVPLFLFESKEQEEEEQ